MLAHFVHSARPARLCRCHSVLVPCATANDDFHDQLERIQRLKQDNDELRKRIRGYDVSRAGSQPPPATSRRAQALRAKVDAVAAQMASGLQAVSDADSRASPGAPERADQRQSSLDTNDARLSSASASSSSAPYLATPRSGAASPGVAAAGGSLNFTDVPAALALALERKADQLAKWRSVADSVEPATLPPLQPGQTGYRRDAPAATSTSTAQNSSRPPTPAGPFAGPGARGQTPAVPRGNGAAVLRGAGGGGRPGEPLPQDLLLHSASVDEGYDTDLEEGELSYAGPARGPMTQEELRQELFSHTLREPSFTVQDLRRREAESFGLGSMDALDAGSAGLYCAVGGAPPLQPLAPQSLVFVASEVAPWSKTGGLADVVGSLPVALAQRGHRVMVVSPRYITSEEQRTAKCERRDTGKWVRVDLSNGDHWVNFHHLRRDGVDWVFVEHVCFERLGSLYCNLQGAAYEDNIFRFSLLSLAALEATLQLELPTSDESWHRQQAEASEGGDSARGASNGSAPSVSRAECAAYGEDVVFVANDWHAGMVPVYLKHKYQPGGTFRNAIAMLAVHNLSFQGTALAAEFGLFRLPREPVYNVMEWIYKEPDGRLTPVVNIMKGALLTADRIVTVSEHYAWEITQETHGVGLHTVLQERSAVLNGIVNGISLADWDPATDPHLAANYSRADLTGKAICKQALKRKLQLPESVTCDVPLVGFIGRLDLQKGPDLVLDALSGIIAMDCQVVMLGSGDPELARRMLEAQAEMPDFFKGYVAFSSPLAHEILAACDILLMPSRFEPCGLNQLYAMRYGTIPVAAATGGLNDTITDVSPFARGDEATGTGWTFSSPSTRDMLAALKSAVQVYRGNRAQWRNIQLACMDQDFSWGKAAASYESVISLALAPQLSASSSAA